MPATRNRRQAQPHKVLHLTTYARLEEYLRAFAAGHFHLLILVGPGGLAKSRSVRAALGGQACWIEGNATPFGMYVKLYRHKDQFVVIDDVDARHPGLKERLVQDDTLRRFVNVYVNDEDVRFTGGLQAPTADGDVVVVLPAVAGG